MERKHETVVFETIWRGGRGGIGRHQGGGPGNGCASSRGPAGADAASTTLVGTILLGDASPASKAHLSSYLNGEGTSALGVLSVENYQERMRGAAYLTMAMPAYQLS